MTTMDAQPGPTPSTHGERRAARARTGDLLLATMTRGAAVLILVMLLALVGVLVYSAAPAIRQFGLGFLVSSQWRANELQQPRIGPDGKVVMEDGEVVMDVLPPEFGAAPVIYGTIVSSVIALGLAVPLSIGAALFIVRVAPRLRIAPLVSFLIEFLASVPSIAFGLWGLFVLAPFLQNTVEPAVQRVFYGVPGFAWMFQQSIGEGAGATTRQISLTGRDMLCGGLILGIMILPIITAVSRDVLKNVPRGQIEGSLALGATWWQSCWQMLRYARSGLFGAMMLGLARAAGETMAVAMVIGNNNQIVLSPFAPAQTMSSLLANEFAEATGDTHQGSLLYVALILLVMSLAFNVVARALVVGHESQSPEH